jgi:hypothetical protein
MKEYCKALMELKDARALFQTAQEEDYPMARI